MHGIKPTFEAKQQELLNSAAGHRERARLLAVQSKESSAWLNALPFLSLGFHLDDEVVRIAVSLCLGVPLCCPHSCSPCGGHVDEFDIHGLRYRMTAGRLPRHAGINAVVKIPLLEHRSRLCWSLWISVIQTVNVLMESPLLLGRRAELLFGTLPVQTPMRCPMWCWQRWRRGHWPHQLRGRRAKSSKSWPEPTMWLHLQ